MIRTTVEFLAITVFVWTVLFFASIAHVHVP